MAALVLGFKKIQSDDKTPYSTFYSNSKAETVINESNIDDVFEPIYHSIISEIQKILGKDSGWIILSVIDYNINISKYNSLASSSYINLPKKLDYPRKGIINIQNMDNNEHFKWSLVRYLHPADHSQARIRRADIDFAKRLYFKDIKFPVTIRDIHQIEKKLYLH